MKEEEEEEQGLSWSSYLALLRAFVRCSSSCAEGHLGVRDKRKADGVKETKWKHSATVTVPCRQWRFSPMNAEKNRNCINIMENATDSK